MPGGGASVKAHAAKTRRQLGDLGALAARTEAAERRILSSAESRLDAVQAALDKMESDMALASDEIEDRYLELVEERGRLNKVIGKARQSLGL